MAGMRSHETGRGAKTLAPELRRITHSGVLDIPKVGQQAILPQHTIPILLTPIVEASKRGDSRPEIMNHIRRCLAEPPDKQWKRIYGALVLVDVLVHDGSPALIAETAGGHYFDLAQRLALLERFDHTDEHVKDSVRRKAVEVRKVLVPLLKDAALKDAEDCKDTSSTCSPGDLSSRNESRNSCSTAGSSTDGSEDASNFEAPEKHTMIFLNNIVAVGHSDDTTDESEGENGAMPAAPITTNSFRDRGSEGASISNASEQEKHTMMFFNNIVTVGHRDDTTSESEGEVAPRQSHPATTISLMGYGSDNSPTFDATESAKCAMILNNIVTVGHNEDTTSESEGESVKNAPVRYRKPRRMNAKARR